MKKTLVSMREVRSLVGDAVSRGKIERLSEDEIEYLYETINEILQNYDAVEKLPYGKTNYCHVVDEVFTALTE